MKAALIPPRGLENYALASGIHLALAIPRLLRYGPYANMYKRVKSLGAFVILDNGAAEGELATTAFVLESAKELGVDEVVATDVIQDGLATISAVRSFLRADIDGFGVMAVTQGTTLREFQNVAGAFCDMPEVTTIGVPRHMLRTLNNKTARLDFVRWLNAAYPNRFNIHLLGTDPWWVGEVRAAAKYMGDVIRSVDSSLPFNYAIAGHYLDPNGANKVEVKRPKDYFDINWFGKCDVDKVKFNTGAFLNWASEMPEPEED